MTDDTRLLEAFEARAQRRSDRREFFKTFGTVAALGGGLYLAGRPGEASAQTVTDPDVLNFALNLEYLEASFYLYAVNGSGLAANQQTGTGTQGTATGGRKVTFSDAGVAAYAKEIAADEAAHVAFLRNALGSSAVALPAIDISASPTGAFSNAARAAGLVPQGVAFDPYASDTNFLLAAFIFEDVGVTAYKGASPLISNKTYLEAAAGILAVEAYHASIIRASLYAMGLSSQANAISDARDSLDGSSDDDQGITLNGQVNNTPLDSNGIAYSRSAAQVLNVVYLNKAAVTMGGFFPNGVNGSIKTSAAN